MESGHALAFMKISGDVINASEYKTSYINCDLF